MVKTQKTPISILNTREWSDFELLFEEGWGGDPSVSCLANRQHHREVASEAARELSNEYKCQDEVPDEVAIKAYNKAAKKLYPEEKLWSGDNERNPDFWRENLASSGWSDKQKQNYWSKVLGFPGSYLENSEK